MDAEPVFRGEKRTKAHKKIRASQPQPAWTTLSPRESKEYEAQRDIGISKSKDFTTIQLAKKVDKTAPHKKIIRNALAESQGDPVSAYMSIVEKKKEQKNERTFKKSRTKKLK